MSLVELFAIFRVYWPLVLGSLVFTLACAGTYLTLSPAQYEAAATIRLGQVGDANLAKPTVPVESDEDALRRINDSEFVGAVISLLGWRDEDRVRLLTDSYRATVTKRQHLRITIRSLTPNDASRAAEASVEIIVGLHKALFDSVAAHREKRLKGLQAEISELESWLGKMKDLMLKKQSNQDSSAAACYQGFTVVAMGRLRNLRSQEELFRAADMVEFNKPTRAVSVLVSEQPVQPKARAVWLFSGFLGILLGVFLVTVVAIRRMKLDAASSSAER